VKTLPSAGDEYEDATGRRLKVTEVNLGAKDGREVIGAVFNGEEQIGDFYSTTAETWAAVWRDKAPPADPRKLKVGG
jgi:hypothetical protein